jgi:hypothetical protein
LEVGYGIDPDYRRSGAAVWWRWILGSQTRSLVKELDRDAFTAMFEVADTAANVIALTM